LRLIGWLIFCSWRQAVGTIGKENDMTVLTGHTKQRSRKTRKSSEAIGVATADVLDGPTFSAWQGLAAPLFLSVSSWYLGAGVFQAMFAAVAEKEKTPAAKFIFSALKEKDHSHAPLLNLVVPGTGRFFSFCF
jgi:hypothetical protein